MRERGKDVKKRRYIPSWVIVLSAILVSCMISGICCILIFKPELPGASMTWLPQSEQATDVEDSTSGYDTEVRREADDSLSMVELEKLEPSIEKSNDNGTQYEKPTLDSGSGVALGKGAVDVESPVLTEPDDDNGSESSGKKGQKVQANGIVSDLSGDGEEEARYKIETVETHVSGVPYTVYVRYCKRNPLSGAWEIGKEKGDPYYGLEELPDKETDPLADVLLINVDEHKIVRGSRCGYSWYGDSFFEAREQWEFFSGGRFQTIEALEEKECKNQHVF